MSSETFWIRFFLAALATWRLTHLLTQEDGPADLIVRLRSSLGHGVAGRLMDCFYCLSIWIAAPLALFVTTSFFDGTLVWLALSGAACLLERSTATADAENRVHHQGGLENVLLWTEENGLVAKPLAAAGANHHENGNANVP